MTRVQAADVFFGECNICRLDFASFADVTLRNATFYRCQLRESDFTRSTLSRLRVKRSVMRACTLTGMG